nr:M48 family metallopeptidase [Candidatus Synechococcus spongiarum]
MVSGLIIRHSRRRWGFMLPGGRLFLNRRLIEAPVVAIDYVITHELNPVTVLPSSSCWSESCPTGSSVSNGLNSSWRQSMASIARQAPHSASGKMKAHNAGLAGRHG